MTLTIPDEILNEAGLTGQEALIEFARSLFDAGKIPLWPAAKLAGLGRVEMESELRQRSIPIYRPSAEDLAQDVATVENLRKGDSGN